MTGLVATTATAPSAWASYIINGDGSALEPDEADAAEAFMDWLCCVKPAQCGSIVSCEPAGFLQYSDARAMGAIDYAADCETYTALVPAGRVQ